MIKASLPVRADQQTFVGRIWGFDWWMLSPTRHVDCPDSSVLMWNIKIFFHLRKANARVWLVFIYSLCIMSMLNVNMLILPSLNNSEDTSEVILLQWNILFSQTGCMSCQTLSPESCITGLWPKSICRRVH